ncbi:MAG: hypothetical protein VB934_18435, partial [Polyangiaceae bacterium]
PVMVASGPNGGILGQFNARDGWITTAHQENSSHAVSIAMALDGSALAAVHRSADDLLRVAHFEGAQWKGFDVIGPTITTRSAPSLVAGDSAMHLVFHGSNFKYYYARYAPNAWSPADEAIEPPGDAQSYGPTRPRLAVKNDEPTVAFSGDDQKVYVQTRSADSWLAAEAVAGSKTLDPPAIVKLKGSAGWLLVYTHNEVIDPKHTKIMWSYASSGEWSEPAIIDPDVFTTDTISIIGLAGGDALLSYRGSDSRAYVTRFFSGSAPTWSRAQAVAGADVLVDSSPSLANGSGSAEAELAAVVNGAAVHLRYDNGTWSEPAAIGGANLLHVAIATAP